MVVVGADVTQVQTHLCRRRRGRAQAWREDRQGHHRWAHYGHHVGSRAVRRRTALGIEDCRNMSARLERDLLAAGQKVVRVPTKLMAQVRKSSRTRGKSDPIDAEAVARAVLRRTRPARRFP